MTHPSAVGDVGRAELTVQAGDTAEALGSGDVAVLGTPRLVALMEQAACQAIGPNRPGMTTVGVKVDITHRRPSDVGSRVVAEATVSEDDGRRITLKVRAFDPDLRIELGDGTHVRARVARTMIEGGTRADPPTPEG